MSINRRRITSDPNTKQDPPALPTEAATSTSSGRDPVSGTFLRGNRCSGGNPYVREQNRIQAAIRAQMTDEVLEGFVADWIRHARSGKSMYLLSLMERMCGRVADFATEERVRDLEAELERLVAARNEAQDGF